MGKGGGEFKFLEGSRKSQSSILHTPFAFNKGWIQLSTIDYRTRKWSSGLKYCQRLFIFYFVIKPMGSNSAFLFMPALCQHKSIFISGSFQLTFQAGLLTDRGRLLEFKILFWIIYKEKNVHVIS